MGMFANRMKQAAQEAARRVSEVARDPSVAKAAQGAHEAAAKAARTAAQVGGAAAEKTVRAARDAGARVAAAAPEVAHSAGIAARSAADRAAQAGQAAGEGATHVAHAAADHAAQAGRTFAAQASQVAHAAATGVSSAAHTAAGAAVHAGHAVIDGAGSAAAAVAAQAAAQYTEGTTAASARPRAVVNAATGQEVVVEAYVRTPGGAKNYAAVYPRGAKSDFGPFGNRAVGALLLVEGAPLLALPRRRPAGRAAIRAGLYFWRKGAAFGAEERE